MSNGYLDFLWPNWDQYQPLAPTQINITPSHSRAGSKFTQISANLLHKAHTRKYIIPNSNYDFLDIFADEKHINNVVQEPEPQTMTQVNYGKINNSLFLFFKKKLKIMIFEYVDFQPKVYLSNFVSFLRKLDNPNYYIGNDMLLQALPLHKCKNIRKHWMRTLM